MQEDDGEAGVSTKIKDTAFSFSLATVFQNESSAEDSSDIKPFNLRTS